MLTEYLKGFTDWAMATGGLLGAGFLMALESMIAPIPSELVMPPLGMAVHQGTFTWEGAILATTVGSLIGSLLSYYMGYFGGKPLVMRVGRWFLINEHHLDLTTTWFKRWGSLTVFMCRFIPVVRHFISIPAGMAKMNLLKFSAYTVIGATLWNVFLLWVGWKLESHWNEILKYRSKIDLAIIVLILMGVVAWYWVHLRKPKSTAVAEVEHRDTGDKV